MESQKSQTPEYWAQTRILEWVAISFSRGSSRPRVWTSLFCIGGQVFFFFFFFYHPQGKPQGGRADSFPQYTDSNANIFLKHLHRHIPKYSWTHFPGTCDLVKGTRNMNHRRLTDDVQSPVCSLAVTAKLWCPEPGPPGLNYLEQKECGHGSRLLLPLPKV